MSVMLLLTRHLRDGEHVFRVGKLVRILIGCGQGWRCLLCNTDVICYFSVAMKIVYGKLGAIRVVTSQLGFARPFSIRFSARNVVPTVIAHSFGRLNRRPISPWLELINCLNLSHSRVNLPDELTLCRPSLDRIQFPMNLPFAVCRLTVSNYR